MQGRLLQHPCGSTGVAVKSNSFCVHRPSDTFLEGHENLNSIIIILDQLLIHLFILRYENTELQLKLNKLAGILIYIYFQIASVAKIFKLKIDCKWWSV